MNKIDTVKMITFLAGNYDSIANKDETQKQIMINTWHSCLNDIPFEIVMGAIKKCIIENPYPPTISEVRKNAVEIMKPSNSITGIEAWKIAYKTICNGLYLKEEQFEELPKNIKTFFGSVRQVKDLALVDIDTINTVVKGQFLKQYETLLEREEKENLLPNSYKKMIENVSNKMLIE